jgi:hypothetical protein
MPHVAMRPNQRICPERFKRLGPDLGVFTACTLGEAFFNAGFVLLDLLAGSFTAGHPTSEVLSASGLMLENMYAVAASTGIVAGGSAGPGSIGAALVPQGWRAGMPMSIRHALLTVMLVAGASPVFAQSRDRSRGKRARNDSPGTPEQRTACGSDVGRFCKAIKPEEGTLGYLTCLTENRAHQRTLLLCPPWRNKCA